MKKKYGKWKVEKCYRENDHIFISKHEETGKIGIIKTPKLKLKSNFRTVKEINNLKKLDHPNIVKLLDYDKEGHSYLLTEYYPGGPLNDTVLSEWSLDEKIKCCKSIYEATKYCHSQGVLRGGPGAHISDILLAEDGKTPILVDFEASGPLTDEKINSDLCGISKAIWRIAGQEYLMRQMIQKS